MNTKQILSEALEAAELIASLNKRCLVVKKLAFNKSSKVIDKKTRKVLEKSVYYCCKIQKGNLKKISTLLEGAEEEIDESDIGRKIIPQIKRILIDMKYIISQILQELNNQEKLKIGSYSQGIVLIQRELKLYKKIEALREDATAKFGLMVKKYKKYLERRKEELKIDLKSATRVPGIVIGIAAFFVTISSFTWASADADTKVMTQQSQIQTIVYHLLSTYFFALGPSINNIKDTEKELEHHMKKMSKKFKWFIHPKIKEVNHFYSIISKM